MEYSLIGDQLAKIAATVDSVQQPYDPDTRCVLSKIFLYWRQCTREACKVGARDRAWCSMKTQKTLRKSMAKWGTWLQGNRGLGAERAAREAAADAQRSAWGATHTVDYYVVFGVPRHKQPVAVLCLQLWYGRVAAVFARILAMGDHRRLSCLSTEHQ